MKRSRSANGWDSGNPRLGEAIVMILGRNPATEPMISRFLVFRNDQPALQHIHATSEPELAGLFRRELNDHWFIQR